MAKKKFELSIRFVYLSGILFFSLWIFGLFLESRFAETRWELSRLIKESYQFLDQNEEMSSLLKQSAVLKIPQNVSYIESTLEKVDRDLLLFQGKAFPFIGPIDGIREANDKRFDFEKEILQKIREGKFNEAQSTFLNLDYVKSRDTFRKATFSIEQALLQVLETEHKKTGIYQKILAIARLMTALGILISSILFYRKAIREISENQDLVRHIEESNQDLELKIEERTKDLELQALNTEKLLLETEKKAKELEKANTALHKKSASELALTELNDSLRSDLPLSAMAEVALFKIITFLGACTGSLFIHRNQTLQRLSAYAYPKSGKSFDHFALGEGLVGQCAKSKTWFNTNYDFTEGVGFGFGEILPKQLKHIPLLFNEEVIGVLELGLVEDLPKEKEDWLIKAIESLAISMKLSLDGDVLKEALRSLSARQEEIKLTEAWYRGIIQSAPDGMVVCNARGKIILTNPIIDTMFGYRTDELLGKAIERLIPLPKSESNDEVRKQFLSGKETNLDLGRFVRELRGKRKDGSEFPVEISISKLPALGGVGTSVCASIRDISDRRAQQQALAESEERSRLILASVNDGIVGLDTLGQVTFINFAGAQMLGYTIEEMKGQTLHDLVHYKKADGSDYLKLECPMFLTGQDGQSRTIEDEVLWKKDGTPVSVEYSTTPIFKSSDLVGTVIVYRDITERKARNEEIRSSQLKLKALFQALPAGVVMIEESGRISEANVISSEVLGLSNDAHRMRELQSQEWKIVRGDMTPMPVEEYPASRALMNKEIVRNVEMGVIRPQGDLVWISTSASPVDVEGGGVAVAFIDITDIKKAAQEVKNTQQQLRALVDSIQSVIFMKDKEGKHLLVNRFYELATGLSSEIVLGKTDFDFMPKEVAESIVQVDRQVMEEKKPITYEEEVPDTSGTSKYYLTTKVPLLDDFGNVYGMCGIATDITDRKLAERTLAENKQQLDMAIHGARLGLWDWNMATNEVITNAIWAELLQYTPEELDQQFGNRLEKWSESLHPDDLEPTMKLLNDHLNGVSEIYRSEYRMRTKSGEFRWFLDTGKKLVFEGEEKASRMIGIITDIHEQKMAQLEIEEAKILAEEATKAKSDFLANMSHEIRTPMNAIIGMTGLALKTELDDKQRGYLEKVNRSSQALLGIINDILDFSKIEAGKMTIEETSFFLEDTVQSVSDIAGLKAHEKKLELLFHIEPGIPAQLMGDPLRLGQVLINLVGNAVKFTSKGEVIVSIKRTYEDSEKMNLLFEVKDSGIGMSPEQMGRLFQAFSQADTSTTRKYGGTGLGLTISSRIVELMGGKISVSSKEGFGSTFSFEIPLKKTSGSTQVASYLNEAKILSGLKVLVVDDNSASRDILKNMLDSFGFRAFLVGSAKEAIVELEKESEPFDLVLMDYMMPELNGIEASKMILKDEKIKEAPTLIMVTAYGREEVMRQAEEAGIKGFLVKPVSPSTLLDTILVSLGKGHLQRARTKIQEDDYMEYAKKVSGIKVLLVEDNEMNQELAMELLTSAGVKMSLSTNGKEALEAVQKEEFSLVLMDCQMPVMDGYEATAEIRKIPRFKNLPILAMTANAMSGDREKCIQAGMNDHIAKPIDVNELFSKLAYWIETQKPEESSLPIKKTEKENAKMSEELQINGVDVKAGLKRTAGNRKLYEKLLRNFINNNQNFGEQIQELLKSGDRVSAERISHTLKGNAGNIGADSLYQIFKELDDELKKESPATSQVTDLVNKAKNGLAELKEQVLSAGVSLQD